MFAMRRKEAERQKARSLRRAGWPLRRIALEVGVAVSSVSVWVRDVPMARRCEPLQVEPIDPEEEIGTKRCGRCHQELPLSSFSRHPRAGSQWWCKECFRAYFRQRGDVHRRQSAAARLRRRAAAREFVTAYLESHPCVDCGKRDLAVLEFDHVRPKAMGISVLIADGWSITRIRQEIELCEVVCANCHRCRTASRSPSWRIDPSRIKTSTRLTPAERRNMLYVHDVLRRGECVDCGCDDLVVLEFDHVGRKRGDVMHLARNGCSLGKLRAEISECEIRCANCHRRRTRATDAGRS